MHILMCCKGLSLSAHNLYRTTMYINSDVEAGTLFRYLKKLIDVLHEVHFLRDTNAQFASSSLASTDDWCLVF
jgi:hypothetical protein